MISIALVTAVGYSGMWIPGAIGGTSGGTRNLSSWGNKAKSGAIPEPPYGFGLSSSRKPGAKPRMSTTLGPLLGGH